MITKTLMTHPAAEIFPQMAEREFEELKHEVEVNWLRYPVGAILNGRHRYGACFEFEVEPWFGKGTRAAWGPHPLEPQSILVTYFC